MARIVNRDEILSSGDIDSKRVLLDIVEHVLDNIDPVRAVYSSVSVDRESRVFRVDGKIFRIRGRIYVVGIGKAACRMARAIEDLFGDMIEDGVVITKYGHREDLSRLKVIEAGHPIPDANSLRGAEEAMKIFSRVDQRDILLFLISGGGSALFEYPEDGISLKDIIVVNDLLVKSGAKIHEINTVRKHISRVKGGKVSRMVRGRIVALIISDVVGDPIEFIASGPTARDPTTFRDAYRIAKLYDVWDKFPESIRVYIEKGMEGLVQETLKEVPGNVDHFIISSNSIACSHAAEKAKELRLKPAILTTQLEGEAKDAGIVLGSIAVEVYKMDRPVTKPALLIAGGESTVTLVGSKEIGVGGPNQELVLSLSKKIRGLRSVAAVSIDTDGADGPTDASGGIVDGYTYDLLVDKGIDPDTYLKKHDSYRALKAINSLVITGATGTNVNSITLILVR